MARSQVRTTLCLSRLGQFGKAFLIYSSDFDDSFPFIGTCHEEVAEPDPNENWLANWPTLTNPIPTLFDVIHSPEVEWLGITNNLQIPRSGTLFAYARFENLYRCPEFERTADTTKTQNVFNYTRGFWARFWKTPKEFAAEGRPSPRIWGDTTGPILKTARVYGAASLPMLIDEQWNRHVATSEVESQYGGLAWNGSDCLFSTDNNVAVSHGQPTTAIFHRLDHYGGFPSFLWKRGGVFFYDGHTELMRDPWPCFPLGPWTRTGIFRGDYGTGPVMAAEGGAIQAYISWLLYAQRGYVQVKGEVPVRLY